MSDINIHSPALLILGAFSRYEDALQWALTQASDAWGPPALTSQPFAFTETDYYTPTMGSGLRKVFCAFERLVDPASLAALKQQTNRWEEDYRRQTEVPEPRPLNLDPGYLTAAKLVLASTKDHSHRLYLADGIYGEVTLYYQDRQWRHRQWTYPDYRRSDYQEFFEQCRRYLRGRSQTQEDVQSHPC